jgi:hypothetical protein
MSSYPKSPGDMVGGMRYFGRMLGFMAKFGWNDFATPTLRRLKKESGVLDREDIRTIGEFIDFDEKRIS